MFGSQCSKGRFIKLSTVSLFVIIRSQRQSRPYIRIYPTKVAQKLPIVLQGNPDHLQEPKSSGHCGEGLAYPEGSRSSSRDTDSGVPFLGIRKLSARRGDVRQLHPQLRLQNRDWITSLTPALQTAHPSRKMSLTNIYKFHKSNNLSQKTLLVKFIQNRHHPKSPNRNSPGNLT